MLPDDDPGWALSWRTLAQCIPIVGLAFRLRGRASTSPDGLVVLRQIFTSFVFALLTFGVVIAALYSTSNPPTDPPHGIAVALLTAGAAGLLAGTRVERKKPLDCTDDTTLANGYRTRFFLRVAFAEAAALFGFVGFFLTYDWWPYPIGLADHRRWLHTRCAHRGQPAARPGASCRARLLPILGAGTPDCPATAGPKSVSGSSVASRGHGQTGLLAIVSAVQRHIGDGRGLTAIDLATATETGSSGVEVALALGACQPAGTGAATSSELLSPDRATGGGSGCTAGSSHQFSTVWRPQNTTNRRISQVSSANTTYLPNSRKAGIAIPPTVIASAT